jgi:hypothetical protein
MLSDVLKALELMTDVIRSAKTPEKKRQRIAKQLLRIYLDIEMVVERGNDILSILRRGSSVYYDVPRGKLQAQQRALQHLIDNISGLDELAVLDLHLPHFKRELTVLFSLKWKRIGFYLSQLTATGIKLTQHELMYIRSQVDWEDARLLQFGDPMPLDIVKRREQQVRVFTTATQIIDAEEALVKIEQLAEQLRQFIIEKFEFEDIL